MKRTCCVIGCEKPAAWQLWDGPMADDYIDTCTAHVGDLLQAGKVTTVYEIAPAPVTA